MAKTKKVIVPMLYNTKGQLESAYYDGNAVPIMNKHAKSFAKELKAYEKTFAQYASIDIDIEQAYMTNDKYIKQKLGIVDKYIDYVPEGDMSEIMGDELTAIAGNKQAANVRPSFSARVASKFQPFFEKQAEKHPKLQALSNKITKAANEGRMPLTAESAAMMRIAYDKKFYNDCRRPGADIDALTEQHDKAVNNLTSMAALDGISQDRLSRAFGKKLKEQMLYDETLTDIYEGMATGDVRLDAKRTPIVNAKGDMVSVAGKPLYKTSYDFVSAPNNEGEYKKLDPWVFKVREKASIDDIVVNYSRMMGSYMSKCENEHDLKKVIDSDSFKYLTESTKRIAAADCPDEAAKFEYEFERANRIGCKLWANEKVPSSKLTNIQIPEPWDNLVDGKDINTYSFNEYESIDDDEIVKNVVENPEKDFDKDAYIKQLEERLAAIESQMAARNQANEISESEINEDISSETDDNLVSEKGDISDSAEVVEDKDNQGKVVLEKESDKETEIVVADENTQVLSEEDYETGKGVIDSEQSKSSWSDKFNTVMNAITAAQAMASMIRDAYNKNKEAEQIKTPEIIDAEAVVIDENAVEVIESQDTKALPIKDTVLAPIKNQPRSQATNKNALYEMLHVKNNVSVTHLNATSETLNQIEQMAKTNVSDSEKVKEDVDEKTVVSETEVETEQSKAVNEVTVEDNKTIQETASIISEEVKPTEPTVDEIVSANSNKPLSARFDSIPSSLSVDALTYQKDDSDHEP